MPHSKLKRVKVVNSIKSKSLVVKVESMLNSIDYG